MATGGSESSFGLTTNRSSSKAALDNFCANSQSEDELLRKIFSPKPEQKLQFSTLDGYIVKQMNQISGTCLPMTRDGLIGPEEVKVTGSVLYEPDRLGISGQGNFSTVRANVCVYKGKWMYEVLLGSKGLMQLGWCSLSCKFNNSEGVGDTTYSYSYDGNRIRKWNVRTEKYGDSWLTGDVISCAIDCDEGTVSFYRNGKSMGVAFESIVLGPGMAYFPAVSLSQGEMVRLNFGSTPFIYPIAEYLPMEVPPEVLLKQSNLLLDYLSKLLPNLVEEIDEESFEHTSAILLFSQIFEHLVPKLKIPYVMQGSFVPFLKGIIDGRHGDCDAICEKLIDLMWGLMEDHEIKLCLEQLVLSLLTMYRFCNAEFYYTPQKSYLLVLLKLMQHEGSRKYAVKWILFDKMKFPLFIYIKPPDDCILQHIVPTVWWESNHVQDPTAYAEAKQMYYQSCDTLLNCVKALEDIQVLILKELMCNTDGNKGPSTRYMFLHKFRELIKENISDNNMVKPQQCSLPVLLALFHRFVRTLRTLFTEQKIQPDDVFVPVGRFIDESLDYFDLQRIGGLKSHLQKTHEQQITSSRILEEKSDVQTVYGNPRVEKSLTELLDDAIILYAYGAHRQLQKMSNVLSETVDSYVTALDDTIEKLKKCPAENMDVRAELERSKRVFEEKVVEQSRHLSWLIAVINSPEKLNDVTWVFDAALRTMENSSSHSTFFDFVPEFYIQVCVDGYMALKNYFKLSREPFTEHSDYKSLLQRYGTFVAKHFADPRIVNIDTKDVVVQSLACFVCYQNSLSVLEQLPQDIRRDMVKSLLAPYENRAWAQTNWILARLWKGNGFAFRFIHLPHLAPAKHQTQEIGAASLQKPCPSSVFQDEVAAVLYSDNKLATQFINSVLNQLNWAFSEFVGMIQELQQLSTRSEKSFVEMRQLKICATCFDISVGLLRVLEMIANKASGIFLESSKPSAELLLARLYQSLCQILNRVASKANVFETILSLNLPGMETVDHFPIVTAILGVLTSLICVPEDVNCRDRSALVLIKEPSFRFDLVDNLMSGMAEQASPNIPFSERKNFCLRNYQDINAAEIKVVEDMIATLSERRNRLDSKSSETGDEESVCTICYAKQNDVIFLPCKHSSCRSCITQHMMQNKNCFFCVAKITKVIDLDGTELEDIIS